MTQFPTTLDAFENPNAGTLMDDPGFEHDVQHANLNDAVEALQVKVGIDGSADQNSLDAKVTAMRALLFDPDATVKFVPSAGGVLLAIWDSVAQGYRPLLCVNGQLATGDIFP